MLNEFIDQWYHAVIAFLPTLLMIALIVVLTSVMSRRVQVWVQALAGRTHAPPEIGLLLGRGARLIVLMIGGLLVLQQLGWTSAVLGFVTGLGVSGIIIGFALQDIVKQFAAGVLLLMLRPFSVGDIIKVSGYEGAVQDIQLRATVLKTADGEEVLIPNADVYTNAVVNRSHYGSRRRTFTLDIPNTIELEQAQAAITVALQATPGVANMPPPMVVATGVTANAITVEARFWVNTNQANADRIATSAIVAARRALTPMHAGQENGKSS